MDKFKELHEAGSKWARLGSPEREAWEKSRKSEKSGKSEEKKGFFSKLFGNPVDRDFERRQAELRGEIPVMEPEPKPKPKPKKAAKSNRGAEYSRAIIRNILVSFFSSIGGFLNGIINVLALRSFVWDGIFSGFQFNWTSPAALTVYATLLVGAFLEIWAEEADRDETIAKGRYMHQESHEDHTAQMNESMNAYLEKVKKIKAKSPDDLVKKIRKTWKKTDIPQKDLDKIISMIAKSNTKNPITFIKNAKKAFETVLV